MLLSWQIRRTGSFQKAVCFKSSLTSNISCCYSVLRVSFYLGNKMFAREWRDHLSRWRGEGPCVRKLRRKHLDVFIFKTTTTEQKKYKEHKKKWWTWVYFQSKNIELFFLVCFTFHQWPIPKTGPRVRRADIIPPPPNSFPCLVFKLVSQQVPSRTEIIWPLVGSFIKKHVT